MDRVLERGEVVTTYPVEFLNSLNTLGFQKYRLRLKVGIPMRNLNPPKQCIRKRLQVTALKKHLIEATEASITNITASALGEFFLVPRITLIPSEYPFEFKRLHFSS